MLRLSMRIIFMGSPQFAVPSLQLLASKYNVVCVVTQPDRRAGRGKKLRSSPVKEAAQELDLPIIQPHKLREKEAINHLFEMKPDLIIVAAYGQILSQEILDIPPQGSINIHASLLPRWRGAAPIQAAILNGDHETGITIMLMDAGLDTGPILSQRSIPILPKDIGGDLSEHLSILGAELLLETLPKYINGDIAPMPQNDDLATYAPMLKKADGVLDFTKPAELLLRQIRAFEPWPTSFFMWEDLRIVVKQASIHPGDKDDPGRVLAIDQTPAITTINGLLVLERIQPAGKKEMDGDAFLRGSPEILGSIVM
jgi:methionyl-tRNA formyltransferase